MHRSARRSREPRGTPPRPPLTRDRILAAAVRIMDRDGLEAVTMRRLGSELGVEAMSLYNHVEGKADVLTGILEVVLAEFEIPEDTGAGWLPRIRDMAGELRRLLHRHPQVLTLLAEQHGPPISARALRPVEAALATLREAGLSERDTVHAYRTLVGFVFGYVVLETGGGLSGGEDGTDVERELRSLPVEELPNVVALAQAFIECDVDAEFEFGLDVVLEGLRARVGAGDGVTGGT